MSLAENQQKLSLATLAEQVGVPTPCAGNSPVSLDDPDQLWFVESGKVNLFIVEIRNGIEQSQRQHLMICNRGDLLFGVLPDNSQAEYDTEFKVIAKGIPGTVLRKFLGKELNQVFCEEIAKQVDDWVQSFIKTLSRFVTHTPHPLKLVLPDTSTNLQPCSLSVSKGVSWASQLPYGSNLYLGLIGTQNQKDKVSGSYTVPITRDCWLTLLDTSEIKFSSTLALVEQKKIFDALNGFHQLAYALEHLNRKLTLVDETNLERFRMYNRQTVKKKARDKLYELLDSEKSNKTISHKDSFKEVMQIIGDYEHLQFSIPKRTNLGETKLSIKDILSNSDLRGRQVNLSEESRWWKTDSGALLGFIKSNNQPVALLPNQFGGYTLIDPMAKEKYKITLARSKLLKQEAWMFYPSFPSQEVKFREIMRIGLHQSYITLITMVCFGLISGLLRAFPALAFGLSLILITGSGSPEALFAIACIIVCFGFLTTLMQLHLKLAVGKILNKVIAKFEAGFWDRVLRLPNEILNAKHSNDLTMSGLSFHNFRNTSQLIVIDGILALLFFIPALVIPFFLNLTLGLSILIFCGLSVLVSLIICIPQFALQSIVQHAIRETTSRLFHIVEGIVKLRIEGAEDSAYALWSTSYRKQKASQFDLGRVTRNLKAFNLCLPYFGGACLFLIVAINNQGQSNVVEFVISYSILLSFLFGLAKFNDSICNFAGVTSAIGSFKPVLKTQAEFSVNKDSIDVLGGDILFDNVSYRYTQDGPMVLDGVTIRARSGEFVAIAGESGSGKSTLFKLALGILEPTSGAILYDARDLRYLNLKQLRRNIGSVPQSIQLHPSDIWDNIAHPNKNATAKATWDAAKNAGIDDQIKSMPMGMMTIVGTGASVFSGGESQRIALARAMVGSPRVILLDEATNWLDNNSQANFMKNLSQMTATRIVIAHRLSTLVNADRIYVLKEGKLVQTGNYEELSNADGLFKQLISKQLV